MKYPSTVENGGGYYILGYTRLVLIGSVRKGEGFIPEVHLRAWRPVFPVPLTNFPFFFNWSEFYLRPLKGILLKKLTRLCVQA
jgi:hypothetical protein